MRSGDVLLSIIYRTRVLIRQTATEVMLLLLIMQTVYKLIGLFIIWVFLKGQIKKTKKSFEKFSKVQIDDKEVGVQ